VAQSCLTKRSLLLLVLATSPGCVKTAVEHGDDMPTASATLQSQLGIHCQLGYRSGWVTASRDSTSERRAIALHREIRYRRSAR
jgi:hypothetical protein